MAWGETILVHFEQSFLFWIVAVIALGVALRNGAPPWAWVIGIMIAIVGAVFLTRRRRMRRVRRAAVAAEANEKLLDASIRQDT